MAMTKQCHCLDTNPCRSCLSDMGTRILRKAGFDPVGERRGRKDPRQWFFERRLITVGAVGRSTKGRRR